jgi:DNA-binding transcriptional LysR family regulator
VTLRQLEYFLAVVQERSFTRAAERLLVAQPSLSQQIRALETELGGPLIERLPGGLALTPTGRAVLPEAQRAVAAARRAADAARGALCGQTGDLEIATLRSMAAGLLPLLLQRFEQTHPGVVLRVHELGHRRELEELVRHGDGDIAVGPRPRDWAGPVTDLGWEEFVVVLPSEDRPRSARARVSLHALRDRRWVLFEPAHGLSEVVAAACAAAGFQPQVAAHSGSVEAIARMAAAGLGPALVPDNAVPSELAGAARRLQPPVAREIVAFSRSDRVHLAQRFVAVLREHEWAAKPASALVIG